MLLGILYVYSRLGGSGYYTLVGYPFSFSEQLVLWLLFFAAFSVKMPVVPFHVWLPEAHVEAPTAGSVILAGILLKLSGYGLLRFVIPVFPAATFFFLPLVLIIGCVSVIYSLLTALRKVGLKNIIGYSSLAHMNLGLLGTFSLNIQGFVRSVLMACPRSRYWTRRELFIACGFIVTPEDVTTQWASAPPLFVWVGWAVCAFMVWRVSEAVVLWVLDRDINLSDIVLRLVFPAALVGA